MEYLQYLNEAMIENGFVVLNLVISGIPSIQGEETMKNKKINWVLNLVISGIPSIHTNLE